MGPVLAGLPAAARMSAASASIRRRLERQTVFIRPPDELDPATVAELAAQLRDVGPNEEVVLDLRRLRFCGAAAFDALVEARNRLEVVGSSITLSHPPSEVLRLLRIFELEDAFTVRQPARHRPPRLSGTDGGRR